MAIQMQLFRFSLFILSISGVYSANIDIKNNCQFPIWPGALTSIGNQTSTTGFELPPGSTVTVTTPLSWTGKFWGRTLCSTDATTGKFSCGTADCGQVECNGAGGNPPASIVEFSVAPIGGGIDFYDISLVDGFNLPVSVTPIGGTPATPFGGSGGCRAVICTANVNAVCPPELAVKGQDGAVIACKSPCMAFNRPEYCCTGVHDEPDNCPPSDYSMIFKNQCPQAYSYAYDDRTSIFTCAAGANYAITFCP